MTLLAIFEALVGANAIWETTVLILDKLILRTKSSWISGKKPEFWYLGKKISSFEFFELEF